MTRRNPPDPDKRLRVGYVAGEMRLPFIEVVLEAHDGGGFEVYCYGSLAEDHIKRIVRWRPLGRLTDAELAEQVARDRIDILIDLAGHTKGNRLLTFARRPAPVQLSWLGYFNTTGLDAIDYLVCDEFTCPPDEDLFTERPLRIDGCYLAYQGPHYAPSVGPLPSGHHITFGCFNRPEKITSRTVRLWARILQLESRARLILKEGAHVHEHGLRSQLLLEFIRHGIDPRRVGFSPWEPTSHARLLAQYGAIDVALDPAQMNGGTTTCEALWMGVPVVNLAGDRFANRIGQTILQNAGCGEWVAHSEDEYVGKALALGRERKRLAEIRAGLREKVCKSTLGDVNGFTRKFEFALRAVWRQWCGQCPKP